MLVVNDSAEVYFLKCILNNTTASDLKLRLYTNDRRPAENDTVGLYTEATQAGYAAISLLGANWVFNTTDGSTTATYPQQTFTFTAAANVYGYYVTNSSGSLLLWAERFTNSPEIISSLGGIIRITPVLGAE